MDDELATMHLSEEHANAVVGLERAGAALSMIGVILIIVTFTLFKRLRTVPNTFILFASIANIGAGIASLIGLTGIAQGSDSSLCRAQAFLLEMFMQADPWWSFAMAFNVYLVFFHSANPTTFRRHLWVYCTICFGLPMIPAIVCLYVTSPEKGPVYGNATLWCWIGDQWNALRIYSYYIPIWICIFLSVLIYVAVGYHVFHQRNQLRNLTISNPAKDLSTSEVRDSAEKALTGNMARSPEGYATVTTEVQITSDVCDAHESDHTPPRTPLASPIQCPWSDDPFQCSAGTSAGNSDDIGTASRAFAVDAELGQCIAAPQPVHSSTAGPSSNKYYRATSTTIVAFPSPPRTESTSAYRLQPKHSRIHYHRRGGGVSGHGRIRASSTAALHPDSGGACSGEISLAGRVRRAWHSVCGKLQRMDPVKLAYLRTSFVFAISVLVTWTPSSINRVYTLIYPDRSSYGLNIASAAVLPLQGAWNAVIYFTTSWNLLREEVTRAYSRSRWVRRRNRDTTPPGSRRRIPGIVVDGGGGVSSMGDDDDDSTEMRSVPLPSLQSHPAGLDMSGSGGTGGTGGSGSGSQRAFAHGALDGGRAHHHHHHHHHHHAGLHGMCYGEDDDTEMDSLDGDSSPSQAARRYRPAAPSAKDFAEPSTRSPPGFGVLRVLRGGQLDT